MGTIKDKAAVTDGLQAVLDTEVKPPGNPCPECEGETKEHHPIRDDDGVITERQRICFDKGCAHVFTVS
jgi:hypothetical protein